MTKRYTEEIARNDVMSESSDLESGDCNSGSAQNVTPIATQIGLWYAVYWRTNNYRFIGTASQIELDGQVILEFIHQTAENVNCFKPTNDRDKDLAGDILTPPSSSRCSTVKLTDSEYQRVQEASRSKLEDF